MCLDIFRVAHTRLHMMALDMVCITFT